MQYIIKGFAVEIEILKIDNNIYFNINDIETVLKVINIKQFIKVEDIKRFIDTKDINYLKKIKDDLYLTELGLYVILYNASALYYVKDFQKWITKEVIFKIKNYPRPKILTSEEFEYENNKNSLALITCLKYVQSYFSLKPIRAMEKLYSLIEDESYKMHWRLDCIINSDNIDVIKRDLYNTINNGLFTEDGKLLEYDYFYENANKTILTKDDFYKLAKIKGIMEYKKFEDRKYLKLNIAYIRYGNGLDNIKFYENRFDRFYNVVINKLINYNK